MLTVADIQTAVREAPNANLLHLDQVTIRKPLNAVKDMSSFEPLLNEQPSKALFPIRHGDIWECLQTQRAAFWVVEEVDMSHDREHFSRLNKDEQHFIKNILAFFATADAFVIDNISDNFIKDVPDTVIQMCYQFQTAMEGIHAQMYAQLIETIVEDKDEKLRLYNGVENCDCIKKKNAWGLKWAYSGAPFSQRLIANAIVEGIFFSGSFCAIYWIQERNIMPGLCDSNKLISRDEKLHCETAFKVYNKLKYRLDEKVVKDMVIDAVNIEEGFINDTLRCDMIGMNKTLMMEYIRYVADVLLLNLGYTVHYGAQIPFDFMKKFALEVKSNFFEKRVTSYQKPSVAGKSVAIEEDF